MSCHLCGAKPSQRCLDDSGDEKTKPNSQCPRGNAIDKNRHTAHISETEKERARLLLVEAVGDLNSIEQWQGFASVAATHIRMAMDVLGMKELD